MGTALGQSIAGINIMYAMVFVITWCVEMFYDIVCGAMYMVIGNMLNMWLNVYLLMMLKRKNLRGLYLWFVVTSIGLIFDYSMYVWHKPLKPCSCYMVLMVMAEVYVPISLFLMWIVIGDIDKELKARQAAIANNRRARALKKVEEAKELSAEPPSYEELVG